MAAFALIAYSIGVDLYQVSLRCLESGFSVASILNALKEIHEEVRARKYLECIEEIYENRNVSDFHSIGVKCLSCRRKFNRTKMIYNEIENALEVDRCEEAFEFVSQVSCNQWKFSIAQNNIPTKSFIRIKVTDSNLTYAQL